MISWFVRGMACRTYSRPAAEQHEQRAQQASASTAQPLLDGCSSWARFDCGAILENGQLLFQVLSRTLFCTGAPFWGAGARWVARERHDLVCTEHCQVILGKESDVQDADSVERRIYVKLHLCPNTHRCSKVGKHIFYFGPLPQPLVACAATLGRKGILGCAGPFASGLGGRPLFGACCTAMLLPWLGSAWTGNWLKPDCMGARMYAASVDSTMLARAGSASARCMRKWSAA